MASSKKYRGILYICLSAFCFACMNVCVRLSGELPVIQKSFFRNIVAFFIAFVVLVKDGGGFHPKDRKNWPYFFLRSMCGTLGILCNFYAVDHLLLSDASMLNKLSPFFAVLASFFILKERFNLKQGFILLGAFIGVLFIVKPSFQNLNFLYAMIGVIGGMCAGIAYTYVRKLGQLGERGPFIVFIFSGFSSLVALPFLIFDYTPMTGFQILALLGAGLAAAGGQFSITAAYCYAPAKEISVYDYSQVIFSAILGFLLFQDVPDGFSILGYIIICSMAIFNFYLKSKDNLFEKKKEER